MSLKSHGGGSASPSPVAARFSSPSILHDHDDVVDALAQQDWLAAPYARPRSQRRQMRVQIPSDKLWPVRRSSYGLLWRRQSAFGRGLALCNNPAAMIRPCHLTVPALPARRDLGSKQALKLKPKTRSASPWKKATHDGGIGAHRTPRGYNGPR